MIEEKLNFQLIAFHQNSTLITLFKIEKNSIKSSKSSRNIKMNSKALKEDKRYNIFRLIKRNKPILKSKHNNSLRNPR